MRALVTEVQTSCSTSSFFVFNIKYPKGCTNFYTFLELTLLDKNAPGEQLTTTVSNFFLLSYLINYSVFSTLFLGTHYFFTLYKGVVFSLNLVGHDFTFNLV